METSIIVPHHSNPNILDKCLLAFDRYLPKDVEVLVVFNNEQRQDTSLVEERGYKALIIEESLGYARAINRGVEESLGKNLIL